MAFTFFQQGCGGTTGAAITALAPYMSSGTVWYVDSETGTDAASPAGQNREKPLATLAQAHSNAANNGDVIILLETHNEVLTGNVILSKGVIVAAEGSSSGVPTVEIGFDAAGRLFLSGVGTELHNVKLTPRTAAGANPRVNMATQTAMRGCYIECDEHDTGAGVQLDSGADNVVVESCTFISVATDATAQPESALKISGASSTDLLITGCVFSDGTVGFSNFYACDLSSDAVTRLEIRNLSLLLGAELKINSSSVYRIAGVTSTGGGKIVV